MLAESLNFMAKAASDIHTKVRALVFATYALARCNYDLLSARSFSFYKDCARRTTYPSVHLVALILK